jgi:hypothetical protein
VSSFHLVHAVAVGQAPISAENATAGAFAKLNSKPNGTFERSSDRRRQVYQPVGEYVINHTKTGVEIGVFRFNKVIQGNEHRM